ncbi:hypothetical protein CROQUDRAFT_51478, partial [Cronartium quercuum f. sp. fusiforme G11]
KSSLCYLTGRIQYRKENHIGRPYYRYHWTCKQLKSKLALELGLPENSLHFPF